MEAHFCQNVERKQSNKSIVSITCDVCLKNKSNPNILIFLFFILAFQFDKSCDAIVFAFAFFFFFGVNGLPSMDCVVGAENSER